MARTKPAWVQGEERFQHELKQGHFWASLVRDRLIADGHDAELTPYHWEPVEFRQQFSNESDVVVHCRTRRVLIECKSRRLDFGEDPSSYPYQTALVDTVYGWDRKADPVAAVVLISRVTRGMLVVPVSTQPTWSVKKTFDRTRGFEDRWYECSTTALRSFRSLSLWLNRFS